MNRNTFLVIIGLIYLLCKSGPLISTGNINVLNFNCKENEQTIDTLRKDFTRIKN